MGTRKVDQDHLQDIWAEDGESWRAWLLEHHASETGVWLHMHKKGSGKPSIAWSEAVDEALCFGWIDSISRSIDDQTYKQYFCPRKPKGNWSRINKAKVEALIAAGKMMPAGQSAIDLAKANGSWTNLDAVEAMDVPDDLIAALAIYPGAQDYFDSLSKSGRWQMLYWINGAKRDTTRAQRIADVATHAAEGKRPPRFRH